VDDGVGVLVYVGVGVRVKVEVNEGVNVGVVAPQFTCTDIWLPTVYVTPRGIAYAVL
jgi:hypothetical protein